MGRSVSEWIRLLPIQDNIATLSCDETLLIIIRNGYDPSLNDYHDSYNHCQLCSLENEKMAGKTVLLSPGLKSGQYDVFFENVIQRVEYCSRIQCLPNLSA